MRRFQISQSDNETFTSHAGLALVGLALENSGLAKKTTHHKTPPRHRASRVSNTKGISTAPAVMHRLLCIGKSDFDALEAMRGDDYFRHTLGLRRAHGHAGAHVSGGAGRGIGPPFDVEVLKNTARHLQVLMSFMPNSAPVDPASSGLFPRLADVESRAAGPEVMSKWRIVLRNAAGTSYQPPVPRYTHQNSRKQD